MRRKVPFMGEERIARADDEAAQAKKARGTLIDDVLSTQKQPSTWDDLVASDYPDPIGGPPKVSRPHVAPPKPARPKTVPVTPGPVPKKAIIESSYSDSTLPSIDWLPINSGHGLRINISGSLDQNLRAEWRRLIEETERSGIGQFEFNLTEAPTLTLTGLGMLLLFKEQKGSERGDIKLCHCNKDVWQMLQWTGMDKYFTIQGVPEN
ncbi:hypothetical protein GCM10011613_27410 [Cellvibrio zantedeschiae]|uniref:STAS domain-containing protein n=1 Tax=Cellvibrio zantedeschiae TaxID=1237077 RepID=A0ABQ3B6V9_9GAMM|nr:STAS domain-containing protein [Cellvibrio zantedeschiae]GGY80877.1 hypothetical protein GCM10011613_27410 [Cellvibrio zantedeschiae]